MKSEKNKAYSHLLDILNGYSIIDLNNQSYYFRHFSLVDSLRFEAERDYDIKKSVKSGIKTEDELLKRAIELSAWSVKEEDKLKSLKWVVKKSIESMSKIDDLKQKEIFKSQIKNQENELSELQKKRSGLVSYSAEHLAEAKKIKKMTQTSLFKDNDFKTQVEQEEQYVLTGPLFSKYAELNSRDNLLRASYNAGFFDLFCAQKGSSIELFGCSAKDITLLQKSLLVLSNSLLNKFKNTNIPEDITSDPVKILAYKEKEHSDKKTSHGVDDLRAKMQARDGKLKAEDFLA